MTLHKAFDILHNLDPSTVIDCNWYGYFIDDTQTLIALLTVSRIETYKDFLSKYEGYTIPEFLEDIYSYSEL